MTKTTRLPRSRAPKQERTDVLAVALRECERKILAEYLAKNDGHVGKTAEALGLSRRALEYKMQSHGLRSDAVKAREEAGISGPRTA